eukprot:6200355-Pleurochrysis_carterae.AAC.2
MGEAGAFALIWPLCQIASYYIQSATINLARIGPTQSQRMCAAINVIVCVRSTRTTVEVYCLEVYSCRLLIMADGAISKRGACADARRFAKAICSRVCFCQQK